MVIYLKTLNQKLFIDYEVEQRNGSKAIQSTNAATFSQISLTNKFTGAIRNILFKVLSHVSLFQRKMVIADTLTNQKINYKPW